MNFGTMSNDPYFVMLVGYIIDFVTSKKGNSKEEFLSYLATHQESNLTKFIQNNDQLANYLASLIQDETGKIESELKELNKMISTAYATSRLLAPIANSLNITPEISTQAIEFIKNLVQSKGSIVIPIHAGGSTSYSILGGRGGTLDLPEKQYAEADLEILVNYNLLTKDYNSKGNVIYKITRQAQKFVEIL